jgi:divalent metal cation (Fe/Co/Zn/Cd) transporter
VTATSVDRGPLVRRGLLLNYATAFYNSLEAIIALGAGFAAGSVALVGFGFDSVIEVSASAAALWRLHTDSDHARRERNERITLRLVGISFLALAIYVAVGAVRALLSRELPGESPVGIALAVLSLVVMPLLARAKRRVALGLGSGALAAETQQTMICTYLSGILLGGLLLNAVAGWWWADPLAALAMVPLIAHEGIEALRGRDACGCGEMAAPGRPGAAGDVDCGNGAHTG